MENKELLVAQFYKLIGVLFAFVIINTSKGQDNRNQVREIRSVVDRIVGSALFNSTDYTNDTSYYYFELLRMDLNNNSKVNEIMASDGASLLFKNCIDWINRKRKKNLLDIEAIAKKANLKNCSILVPIIIISDDYKTARQKIENNPFEFYKYKSKNIEGFVYFVTPLTYKGVQPYQSYLQINKEVHLLQKTFQK